MKLVIIGLASNNMILHKSQSYFIVYPAPGLSHVVTRTSNMQYQVGGFVLYGVSAKMTKKNGRPCKKCGTSDWLENSSCKQCNNERAIKWRNDNPERSRENDRNWKRGNPERVRESDRRYRRNNSKKVNEYNRKWRRNNPEKKKESDHKWQRNNPEKAREHKRIWKHNHPEKIAAKDHRRRTRKTGAGGSYTAEEWKAVIKHQDGRCLACGKKTKLTADHIIPVIAGGTSDISNIQGLCGPCNSSKGAKTIDYRKEGGILRWIQEKLL